MSLLTVSKLLINDVYKVTILLNLSCSDREKIYTFGDIQIDVGGPTLPESDNCLCLSSRYVYIEANFCDPNGVTQTFSVTQFGQTNQWNEQQAEQWAQTTSSKVVMAITLLRLRSDNFTETTSTEF